MPSKTIEDFAYQVRDYMRGAEVVKGKNLAYSQENNAVIATIENGKSYKVRWTGSATVTLKKNSASGTEVTSGSTSPLSFTADSDFDLYFGSSADVTEIMVYDGNETSDTYEPYYVPVKDSKLDIADQQVLGAWNELNNKATTSTISPATFTVNADKSVSVAVSSTPSGNVIFNLDDNATIKAGTRYLSGCPNIDSDDVFIQIYKSGVIDVKNKRGTEQEFTVATDITGATIRIVIGSGVSADKVDGKVFKPMISLEPNQPYVPYAMTNRELTEVVDVTNKWTYANDISGNATTTRLYKIGNMIIGNLRFTTPATASNDKTIGSLSPELNPPKTNYIIGQIFKTWNGEHAGMLVYQNTTTNFVLASNLWTPGVEVVCNVCFPI